MRADGTPAPAPVLGLGGSHRHRLPRGHRPGPQTWWRRVRGGVFWLLSGFFALAGVAAIMSRDYALAAATVVLLPWPYVARPLRGGVFTRAPSRARGIKIATDPPEPRRGEDFTVSVRGRGSRDGLELGLIATSWTDVPAYRSTRVVPMRVHERWTRGDTLQVPLDQPFSYEGRHLSVAWALVARLPSGRVATRPLWVRP